MAGVDDAPDLLLPRQKGQSHASPLLRRGPIGAMSDGSRLAPCKPHLLQEEERRKQWRAVGEVHPPVSLGLRRASLGVRTPVLSLGEGGQLLS